MKNIKYSVLMSVYFKEKPEYLKISIESMLNQTIKPDEFIVIKDGPLTPNLDNIISKYVKKYPNLFVILKNKTNLGLGPSLNRGIKKSKNEIIARMDSDDYSIPTRCEEELDILNSDSNIGIVGSFEAEFINDINNVVSIHKVPETNDEINTFMRRRCAILHPTVMYKKSDVIKSGGYHNILLYEDYDLFSRMTLKYGIRSYNIQKKLYFIRTSPEFYKRRGGWKYAKTALKFKRQMYKDGYMNKKDFIISGWGQVVVSLLPNKLRELFYNKLLRK